VQHLAARGAHFQSCFTRCALLTQRDVQLAWLLGELFGHLADRHDHHAVFVAFARAALQSPGVAASGKSFHSFAQHTVHASAAARGDAAATAMLAAAARADALPLHGRMLFAIALAATLPHGGSADEDAADNDDSACALVHSVVHDVFLEMCGQQCAHAAVLSDLLVDTCSAGGALAGRARALDAAGTSDAPADHNHSRDPRGALLRLSHRLLLGSHCAGVACQRLQLASRGHPVVFGKTPDREMFVCRLQLPTRATRATETHPTASGWWLKVERCAAGQGADETTYSLFLNNGTATAAAPLKAAFEIGVVAHTAVALRKAEAAAVLIEHAGFMRPGLWAPQEAAIHRSAIRQEFSGTAWGIRHLCSDVSLAQLGYDTAAGPEVCVFGMVQLS
jgi:hypothetical protein